MKVLVWTGLIAALLGACGDDGIDSDEEARRAYLGLDQSIATSMDLGFDGFNAASSANIAPQTGAGLVGGVIVITGQVDQGASDNKGMRLKVGMTDYTDGPIGIGDDEEDVNITFDTAVDPLTQPDLTLSLKNIPTGTLEGTLVGTYLMIGDISGEVMLNLSFAGSLRAVGTDDVERVPGTTAVTGTATTSDGTFTVDLTL